MRRGAVCVIGLVWFGLLIAGPTLAVPSMRYGGYSGNGIPIFGEGVMLIDVPDEFVVQDVKVWLDLEHEHQMSDIKVILRAPGGEEALLWDGTCLFSPSLEQMRLMIDDEARHNFPANYCNDVDEGIQLQPARPLSRFDGLEAQGQWMLRVVDDEDDDHGGVIRTVYLYFHADLNHERFLDVEADLSALDGKVTALHTEMNERMNVMQASADRVEADVLAVSGQVAVVQLGVDEAQSSLDTLDAKADVLEDKVDSIADHLTELDAEFAGFREQLDLAHQIDLENACLMKKRLRVLYLPEALGGIQEQVAAMAQSAIDDVAASGESTWNAQSSLDYAETMNLVGRYKEAYKKICTAYCLAVSTSAEANRCSQW